MRCSACRRTSDQLRYVERSKRSGFGYRTVRSFLCPSCAPSSASAAGAVIPPVVPSQKAEDGAVVVGSEPSEGRS